MIGDLAAHNDLKIVSQQVVLAGLKDAAGDIQYGLGHLGPQELASAISAGFIQPTGDPDTFAFNFSITTTSIGEEFTELVAMNALNAALDLGESDFAPLNTGFPFPGTTDYQFTYDIVTHDLDLHTV